MSPQAIAQTQGALEIDAIIPAQLAEVGAVERFRAELETARLGIVRDHREAGAVDGNAFAQTQLGGDLRGGDRHPAAAAIEDEIAHSTEDFDKAGEHRMAC